MNQTIKIIKKEDDELNILRASIGGTKEIGWYLVYRGETKEVKEMLKVVLDRFTMDELGSAMGTGNEREG